MSPRHALNSALLHAVQLVVAHSGSFVTLDKFVVSPL